MAPPAKVNAPPQTLPADFFDKQGSPPETLPADFDFGTGQGDTPKPPLTDARNRLQKAFDAATQTKPIGSEPGVSGLLDTTLGNVGGGVLSLAAPLFHPEQTAKTLLNTASGMFSSGPGWGEPVKLFPDAPSMQESLIQGAKAAKKQPSESGKQYAARIGGEALAAVPQVAAAIVAPKAGRAVADGTGRLLGNLKERYSYGGYRSPVVAPGLQNASKVAEAIRPPGGISPHFEEDLQEQIPLIKAHAAETGNPLHSQWEAEHAARGLAQRGLSHFREQILGPHAERTASLDNVPTYGGVSTGEGRATLGAVEKRISDINDLIRGAVRSAKTTGQELTAEQRLGLENEGSALRDLLHRELAEHTGIPRDSISSLRQGYGKQFGIADAIGSARRARLGQTGASAEMGGSVPFSKTGLLEKMAQKVRGGQQYIADSRLRRALRPFEVTPIEFPSAAPWQRMQEILSPANREAAEKEFLHSNTLQTAAQDASQQRALRAAALRNSKRALNREAEKSYGETMRSISSLRGKMRGAKP